MSRTVSFSPGACADYTPHVRAALADCSCGILSFAPGRYDFWPTRAAEEYLFLCGNDEGLKRIAFPIFGREGLVVEGEGARFIFHWGMLPFALTGSREVTLRGFSIDWDAAFHAEGEVKESLPGRLELEIPDGFAYRVSSGSMKLGETGPRSAALHNILELDPARRETAFLAPDQFGAAASGRVTGTFPGRVSIEAAFASPQPRVGSVVALTGARRDWPAIAASGCRDLRIENVSIHHAGGTGILAQRCENVLLSGVGVSPAPGSGRLVSTLGGGALFVNCRGVIRVTGCVFEGQLGDAIDAHGIHAEIAAPGSPRQLDLRLRHPHHLGAEIAAAGDRIELLDRESLVPYHQSRVVAAVRLNKEYWRIGLESPPSRAPREGDVLANLDWSPGLEVSGSVLRGNRGGGVRVTVSGPARIEDNTFHVPGAAVAAGGDAACEAGGLRDLAIRGNRFVSCNFGIWGRAALQFAPGIASDQQISSRYHRNVRIEDNRFVAFDPRLLHARCTDGIRFLRNRVVLATTYPLQNAGAAPLDVARCDDFRAEANTVGCEAGDRMPALVEELLARSPGAFEPSIRLVPAAR